MPDADEDLSPVAPLRSPVYRMLWIAWLMASTCMAMNGVAACPWFSARPRSNWPAAARALS